MDQSRCQMCGVAISRLAADAVCPTCAAGTDTGQMIAHAAPLAPAVWLWSAPEAATAIATRDLPTILRTYRRINHLSQAALAEHLGYDNSYISRVETGKRAITDIATRRHIATRLGIPAHVFGITGVDDAEFRAMLQFGDSTVRLAEIARQAGRAVEAVNELWPLVARLEARAVEGHLERDSLILLTQARVALGVSLGTVLPEERLASAAQWTGQALTVARHLEDSALFSHTLRMHGNELRKAGNPAVAVTCLQESLELAQTPADQGACLAFLCRATSELGDAETFDTALSTWRHLLDTHPGSGLLFHPFTLRENEIRGLMGTGRTTEAARAMTRQAGPPAAPQWHIIERVTSGEILANIGDTDAATTAFTTAIAAAEHHRLPHQIQRMIRATVKAEMTELSAHAKAALRRIQAMLSSPS